MTAHITRVRVIGLQGDTRFFFLHFREVPVWIGAHPLEFFFYRLPEVEIPFDYIPRTVGPRGSVSERTLQYLEIRVERRWNDPSISFRSGCVLLEGVVFGEIFPSFEGKIGKMIKNSITPIDRERRDAYFGPVNILVKKYLKIVENISGDLEFFWNFRKFFYH